MKLRTAFSWVSRRAAAPALICLAASCAAAQGTEPAKVSRLAGIPLPAGAQRVLDKQVAGQAVKSLEALAKQLNKTCDDPEVLVWLGAEKPETDAAIKAVSAQLEKAGYRTMDTAPAEGSPAPMKRIVAALGPKQAILGFWAANDQLLTLAWCRAGAGQAPAEPSAPAPADTGRLPTFPKLKPKPGYVMGTALKIDGKPLVGAEITISGTTMFGQRTSFTGPTDDQGRYELPLPDGVYRLSMGTWRVRYDGRAYRLPLRTESGDADMIVAKKGAIGNWALQIRGQVPNSDLYYGGTVVVSLADARAPKDVGWREGMVVEVTLTPQGPLVDGSQGRPLLARYTVPSQEGNSAFLSSILLTIPGVPIGRYSVAARVMEPGGAAQPLTVVVDVHRPAIGDDRFAANSKPLYFQPAEAGGEGVDNVALYLQP